MSLFPFTAIVGLDEVKRLMLLALVDPAVGPVIIAGPPGTGKSTAIRGLAGILPDDEFMFACPSNCPPSSENVCDRCRPLIGKSGVKKVERPIPFVQLPFTATSATLKGTPRRVTAPDPDLWELFEPGLLALSNGGVLTIEKGLQMPKEIIKGVFDALTVGKVSIDGSGIRFTYPFRTTPIIELEDTKVPDNLRRYCRLMARSAPPASTEEKVMILKRVQEFDLSPKRVIDDNSSAMAALRTKVTEARRRAAQIKPDENIIKLCKRKATSAGAPDAWSNLCHAAIAASAIDETPVKAELVDEVAAFLVGRTGGV